jgi:hypothetical protein
MGWQHEEHGAHEGGMIGYAVRDGCALDAGLYRELAYPRDDGDRRIACIAAGCDCGWRSPRWVPRQPATWAPFSVQAAEADEDRARALWRRHLELDVIAAHPLRVDAAATRAELARRGEHASAELADADVIDLAGSRRR